MLNSVSRTLSRLSLTVSSSSPSTSTLFPALSSSLPSSLNTTTTTANNSLSSNLLSFSSSAASSSAAENNSGSGGGSSGKTDTGAFVSSDSLGGAQAYTGFGDGGGSIFETTSGDSDESVYADDPWSDSDGSIADGVNSGAVASSDAEQTGGGLQTGSGQGKTSTPDGVPSAILSDLGASYLVASIPGLKNKLEASHAATKKLQHTDKAAILAQALGKPLPIQSYRELPVETRVRDPARRPLRTPSWGALIDQLPVAGRAVSKNIPGSIQKLAPIAATLRGMHVVDALPQMAFSKKRVAKTAVYKTLRSALNNAVSNAARKDGAREEDIDPGRFIISEAWAGKGIIRKRLKFHAKGRHGVEEKTRSHLWIQLKADPDYRPDSEPLPAPGSRVSQSVRRKGQLAATRRAEAARFIASLPGATAAATAAQRARANGETSDSSQS